MFWLLTVSMAYGQIIPENLKPTEKSEAIKKNTFKGNITYLLDTRDFNSFGIWMKKSNLWGGFSFLGFTDIHGEQNLSSNRFKLKRTFSKSTHSPAATSTPSK